MSSRFAVPTMLAAAVLALAAPAVPEEPNRDRLIYVEQRKDAVLEEMRGRDEAQQAAAAALEKLLPAQPDRTILELTTGTVTNTASDADVPAGYVVPDAHVAVISIDDVMPRSATRRAAPAVPGGSGRE